MFCGKCGAQNTDNTEFCTNCGAKLKKDVSTTVSAPSQNNKNRKVGMIAVAAVVVMILGIVLFGGRSYRATVEKYVDAQFDANAEAIFDLMPEKMIDYVLKEYGFGFYDLDDLIDSTNETLQYELDALDSDLGKHWKVSYKILNAEDIEGYSLDDIKSAYEDVDVKVSAAKNVEIEITVKGDEDERNSSKSIPLIKVGRFWYLDITRIGNIF